MSAILYRLVSILSFITLCLDIPFTYVYNFSRQDTRQSDLSRVMRLRLYSEPREGAAEM
jgi:hypothetical protein